MTRFEAPAEPIHTPDSPALEGLCDFLLERAGPTDLEGIWPADQLDACGKSGVFAWFMPTEWGGEAWSYPDIIRGYLRLSAACLTTTFIITQRTGACERIAGSDNEPLKREWLPKLTRGEVFATVGISHLTTSRRHLAEPVLKAEESGGEWKLRGFSPWVTGAAFADLIVTGATLEDGRQVLCAVPTARDGVEVAPPAKLLGLSSSFTGAVHFHDVAIGSQEMLAGPVEDVMSRGRGAGTGGLQTSTLALGLARAAVDYLEEERQRRDDLAEVFEGFRGTLDDAEADLLALARGQTVCTPAELRGRANSLVMRATQAALTAAKGTGYLIEHPVSRWCREALFFLVWSCPQPIAKAHLCELAGIAD